MFRRVKSGTSRHGRKSRRHDYSYRKGSNDKKGLVRGNCKRVNNGQPSRSIPWIIELTYNRVVSKVGK